MSSTRRRSFGECTADSGNAKPVTTVAMRRVSPGGAGSLLGMLAEAAVQILPNTAGCHTASEALLTARLGREALGTDWVKLEVVADDHSLLPDPVELLEAARLLVRDGFTVPLCREHHQELHRHGNEVAWWANLQITPLPVATELWRQHCCKTTASPQDFHRIFI